MLIIEDLFMLLRRDDGKPESALTVTNYGFVAAVITDLILAERVTLSADKDPRVQLANDQPTGHPVLDAALSRLADKNGKRLSSIITDSKLAPEADVAQALAQAGVIGIEEKRALGLIPARYPVLDPKPEQSARERLRAALAGQPASPADTSLLAILQSLNLTTRVLPDETASLTKAELKDRIKQITEQDAGGRAMAAADQAAAATSAMNAALMTAVIMPIVTSN